MSRTDKLKVGYGAALGLPVLAIIGLGIYGGLNVAILILSALAFRIPGWLTRYVWKDFLTGRRMMDAQRHEEAIPFLLAFLEKLEAKPWIGSLIWVTPSFYTVSVRAMALNNLGACRLEMGELSEAEKHFRSALEIDSLYPLPHFNLAVVAAVRNEASVSQEHLAKAEALGYSGDVFDQSLDRIKSAYARFEPTAQ